MSPSSEAGAPTAFREGMSQDGQQPKRQYRCNDMALVAFLRVKGFKHRDLELFDKGNVLWVFDEEEDLLGHIEDYSDGVAEVEPRDFTQSLGHVRKGLYGFLREQGLRDE